MQKEVRKLDWIKNNIIAPLWTEIKDHWRNLLVILLVILGVNWLVQEFKSMQQPTQIVQTSPAPINLNYGGQQTAQPAPVYVYVGAQNTETATAGIKQKETKDSADVVVKDDKPTYLLDYNGKKFQWVAPVEENYKFENGQMYLYRQSQMNLNVEVPQPQWSIGIGESLKGGEAIKGDIRIGRIPFNIWGYASQSDPAVGIAFTQYNSGGSKVKEAVIKEEKKNEKISNDKNNSRD